MADLVITSASVVAGSGAVIHTGDYAGQTISAGKAVYKPSVSGRWSLADNNSATAEVRQPMGIALHSTNDGQPITVLRSGPITIGATLTPGTTYYLSDTPGGICPVADLGSGEYPCIVGIAQDANVLLVNFQYSGVAL